MGAPLCGDLDGTLVRSDMLIEGVLASATNPLLYRALLGLRSGSRAAFKRSVAAASKFDPALLPYNDRLLAFLREQRRLVAGWCWSRRQMRPSRIGLPPIWACLTRCCFRWRAQIEGAAQGRALIERFGQGGFSYVGIAGRTCIYGERRGPACW